MNILFRMDISAHATPAYLRIYGKCFVFFKFDKFSTRFLNVQRFITGISPCICAAVGPDQKGRIDRSGGPRNMEIITAVHYMHVYV